MGRRYGAPRPPKVGAAVRAGQQRRSRSEQIASSGGTPADAQTTLVQACGGPTQEPWFCRVGQSTLDCSCAAHSGDPLPVTKLKQFKESGSGVNTIHDIATSKGRRKAAQVQRRSACPRLLVAQLSRHGSMRFMTEVKSVTHGGGAKTQCCSFRTARHNVC